MRYFTVSAFLVLLLFANSAYILADEALRIAGMGGAFAGLHCDEASIFGNPAGLIHVKDNNLSTAFTAQNLDYENLTKANIEQMNVRISFRLTPAIYYSRMIKGLGISLGYTYDLDSISNTLRVENTEAEYIVDERKFVSDTNTVFEYDLFREQSPVISMGYRIRPGLSVGMRMKYRHQIVKVGTITRPLRLTSVHDAEVNRNDATKLIPAIIDNLDAGDAIKKFKEGEYTEEDVVADLSGGGLDVDLGLQTRIPNPNYISIGFMLDHLIQSRIVDPQPSVIRVGVGVMPVEWLAAAFDLQKALSKGGLGMNLGWEINYDWERWFKGGIILRHGVCHESSEDKMSLGLGFILGNSQWNYTIMKALDGSPIRKAGHMFSSTIRF